MAKRKKGEHRPHDPNAHKRPLIPTSHVNARCHEARPMKPPAPSPEAVRREQIAPGVGVARRMIFQCTTDRPEWWHDMLLAVATAKRLGLTGFELDVAGAPVRQQRPQRSSNPFMSFIESAEPWMAAGGAAPVQVTVYAVVVE